VGGIKEKVLAAHRAGITTFVLPVKNRKDIDDVPESVRRNVMFVFVGDMREVLSTAFHGWPAEMRGDAAPGVRLTRAGHDQAPLFPGGQVGVGTPHPAAPRVRTVPARDVHSGPPGAL
jgi:hypothetical protein